MRNPALFGLRPGVFGRLAGRLQEFHGHDGPQPLARLDRGEVEQVGDELAHAVGPDEAAVQHVVVSGQISAEGALLDHVQVAFDGRDRCLHLVGEHGDELEPDLAFFLGEPAGLALQDQVARRLADGAAQFLGRERLGQEVVGAAPGGRHGGLERRVGGDHDGQQVERPRPRSGRECPARSCRAACGRAAGCRSGRRPASPPVRSPLAAVRMANRTSPLMSGSSTVKFRSERSAPCRMPNSSSTTSMLRVSTCVPLLPVSRTSSFSNSSASTRGFTGFSMNLATGSQVSSGSKEYPRFISLRMPVSMIIGSAGHIRVQVPGQLEPDGHVLHHDVEDRRVGRVGRRGLPGFGGRIRDGHVVAPLRQHGPVHVDQVLVVIHQQYVRHGVVLRCAALLFRTLPGEPDRERGSGRAAAGSQLEEASMSPRCIFTMP